MVRILGSTGSRRRRRYQLGAIVSMVTVLGLIVAQPAFAVHDLEFQLDGDVLASTTTSIGGSTQLLDWDSLFTASGTPKALPANFTASGFDRDFLTNSNGSFNTSDQTTFATGSKDTLNPTPGWQCNVDNNVNSKIDIMNAYAGAYTNPANQHQILYFALERNANTGDGNVAFWFLQDDVNCVSTGGSVPFTGNHTDGDLLAVSAFTKGGGVSTIDVYRWNGGAGGSLGTTSVAHGVDCKSTAGLDAVCATTNSGALPINGSITTPWPTSNKQDGPGNTLREAEFFEGGIDLTQSNLGGKCFNVFIGDTRSSQSLTATLFDFARGKLGECTSSTTTTPSITSAQIPANGQLSVSDTATVTVTGVQNWTGTYDFHLCFIGTDITSTATCTTGGTLISSQSINQSTSQPLSSGNATVTSAGRYCWRGDFTSTTSGVPNAKDDTAGECFNVTPRQPTLTTQATTGPVDFGQPISDTATLSNTANQPGTPVINPTTAGGPAGGTISFTAFGPDSCSTVAFGPVTRAVSGDDTYPTASQAAVSFTPSAPGTYVFVASYSGNLPNTKDVPATACADQPGTEKVLVRQIPTEIKTKQSWFPNDTATIKATTGNLAAGGTVVFSLYDNATCSSAAKYTETKTLAGGNPTEEVSTNNTTFNITTGYADAADSVVAFSWKVVYTPAAGDTAHTGKQSACDAEHFSIKYTNDAGPGTNLP